MVRSKDDSKTDHSGSNATKKSAEINIKGAKGNRMKKMSPKAKKTLQD